MSTTIAICAVGWLAGWWAFGRPRRVESLEEVSSLDGVAAQLLTIVIPARNEVRSLSGLLDDLERQRPLLSRVVVVDDHSTDGTVALARTYEFVEVVEAEDLPEGWTGKSWACWSGAEVATGDTLIFLDADVRLDPGMLDRLVVERDRRGGLISVQPWHVTAQPYEQLSALFNVIALMGVGVGGRSRPAAAFGPVLVTSRDDYELVGGHRAVRHEVAEDVALGRRYRSADREVTVLTGSAGIRYRMYPGGIRQLVQGWTRSMAAGAGATPPVRLVATAAWIAGMGSAAVALVDGVSSRGSLVVGVVLYLLFVAQLHRLFDQVGAFGIVTAALYPVLVVAFLAVFTRSMWRTHVRHSVRWRGRLIPVGDRRDD